MHEKWRSVKLSVCCFCTFTALGFEPEACSVARRIDTEAPFVREFKEVFSAFLIWPQGKAKVFSIFSFLGVPILRFFHECLRIPEVRTWLQVEDSRYYTRLHAGHTGHAHAVHA
jgi:hypothetical protein